jgi:hypothetical protein
MGSNASEENIWPQRVCIMQTREETNTEASLNVCSPLALTLSVLSEFLLTNARRFGRLLPSVSKFSGV